MSLGESSLFSQKKGAVNSIVVLVAVMAMVVGILSVNAAHSKTITLTPTFAAASFNQSYNFTITLGAGSATINEVRITKPSDYSAIYCLESNPVGGWSCPTNGTASALAFVEFTGGSLAAGASMSINITSTTSSNGINHAFSVRTLGDGEAANTTNINVTVDSTPPFVQLINVTDGTNSLLPASLNGKLFLKNTSSGYVFVINTTDSTGNSSGISKVALFYNVSNSAGGTIQVNLPVESLNGTNTTKHVGSNGTFGPGLFNVTLNLSLMSAINGTSIAFTIGANDTVGNGNYSNSSANPSSFAFNFTIDSAAPIIQATTFNQTSGINVTNFAGLTRTIVNSTVILNLSVVLSDDGGSGTVHVRVRDRSGSLLALSNFSAINGTNGRSTWNYSRLNITDLVTAFSTDGVYNITVTSTDNVTNTNSTYNLTVEVDDTPPAVQVLGANISVPGSAILGNVTDRVTFNNTFNITISVNNNVDNGTRNVSVFGNKGTVHNMTFVSGTLTGTSLWSIKVGNASGLNGGAANGTYNLSEFCDISAVDRSQCNFRFNVSDVMGKFNDTVNFTVFVDTALPTVRIDVPVTTLNYSSSILVNVSVNDTIGPLMNVSFRLRASNGTQLFVGQGGELNATHINVTNATKWTPLTLTSGNNSQPDNGGYWSFTINVTAEGLSEGNYSVEVNATDSAGWNHTFANVTNFYIDTSMPTNFTVVTPVSNAFNNSNFTISLNVTERFSGVKNVSFRIENGTYTSSWLPAFTEVKASVLGQLFNASGFNITHVGLGTDNLSLNATDGNFSVRFNITDTAGNQNTTVVVNFTIDTIQPRVAFINPLNNLNQTGNFTVNATINESNVNTVQVRWENGSVATLSRNNGTFTPMTRSLTALTFNATFTNLTDGSSAGTFLDSNYTLRINVTDKAGNFNDTIYIQLVLDDSMPVIGVDNPVLASLQTANFVINASFNDTLINSMGNVNSTNINVTSFRFENSTFNSTWATVPLNNFDMTNTSSNRTNSSFTFSSLANGNYDFRLMVNDTAGNSNSTHVVKNITFDSVAAGVSVSLNNVSPTPSGGAGIAGRLSFNVTVTDNIPLNVSIANFSDVLNYNGTLATSSYGVFYRFESTGYTGNWMPMNLIAFSNAAAHSAVYNASNLTTVLNDTDFTVRINATDRAGNQNTTTTFLITVQNGGSAPSPENLTFQGGFVTGSDTNVSSPTMLLNTTTNSTCRYSLDVPKNNYNLMTSTMGNNVSREHRTVLGFLPDRAASGYVVYYACKDVGGNFTPSSTSRFNDLFSVDTRNFYNVTMGSAGTNKVRGDYFAVGWNSFQLPKTTLLANTAAPTNYNITNVLSSLGSSTLATANFTTIFAYNGTAWASYVVGASANTFTNFTSDTPTSTYYINITTSNERLEIN